MNHGLRNMDYRLYHWKWSNLMTCSLTHSVYGFIVMEKFRILLATAINPFTIESSTRKHHPNNLCTMKKKVQKC